MFKKSQVSKYSILHTVRVVVRGINNANKIKSNQNDDDDDNNNNINNNDINNTYS